ncbi:MAG: tetratricopeptide repeat protein [Patescibacteria group bacterium]|jgi:tetratricopeptide (TPR) repeat protein
MIIANIIALAVIVICLLVVIIIIVKKFPALSNIDVNASSSGQDSLVKKRIVREKLRRNLVESSRKMAKKMKPTLEKIFGSFKTTYQNVLDLEKRYRAKVSAHTPQEKEKIIQQAGDLVSEGRKLTEEEEFEAAERKFIDAISLDHKNIEAYQGLGDLYWEKGKLDQAQETFEYIIKMNADNFDAYSRLGNIAIAQGDLEKARGYYLKSLELDSQAAVRYFDLANVYKESRDYSSAKDSLEKAVGLEPNNPRYLDSLIDICIIVGDKDEAKDTLAHLKKVNPENNKIKEFAKKIRDLGKPLSFEDKK